MPACKLPTWERPRLQARSLPQVRVGQAVAVLNKTSFFTMALTVFVLGPIPVPHLSPLISHFVRTSISWLLHLPSVTPYQRALSKPQRRRIVEDQTRRRLFLKTWLWRKRQHQKKRQKTQLCRV